MGLLASDIQNFLGSEDGQRSVFRSESGDVGRVWLDDVLIIYDLNDIPAWLGAVLKSQDEDGNTGLDQPRTRDKEVSELRIALGR